MSCTSPEREPLPDTAASPPPDILYKYRGPCELQIFKTGRIRFNLPSSFNDTLDCFIPYAAPRTHFELYKQLLQSRMTPNSYRIFCLSATSTSGLMWAHSADGHRGFAVGFDAHHPFFSEDGRCLRRVEYLSRPRVLGPSENPDSSLPFAKSTEWAYEKEWRCVKQVLPPVESLNTPDDIVIPSAIVREVILGQKSDPCLCQQIAEMSEERGFRPRFLKSQHIAGAWNFENDPSTRV